MITLIRHDSENLSNIIQGDLQPMKRLAPILPAMVVLFFAMMEGDTVVAEDWPQWRGVNRDGVWRETGIIERFDAPQIKLRWRTAIGAGYSGPTVADGRVFITDKVNKPNQQERVLCLSEEDGKILWSHAYDCIYTISYTAGPRAAVTVDEGRAYALGAMGHLHCFDAKSGDILWQRDLNEEYKIHMPIWGIAASPLVVGDRLILHIGGEDACVVALNKTDGKEIWTALADRASYSAPILIEQAGQPVVVCWNADSVAGLDPNSGKVHWRYPFPPLRMPIGIATPIVSGEYLFVTSFYDGALMLRLPKDRLDYEKVWQRNGQNERRTDALQSIISTPLFYKDYLYGVDSYGELRCLDPATGDRIWEDLTATPKARWSNIHFVRNGDKVWMFNERGELIISKLSPQGFDEISRAKLIEPTLDQLRQRGGVCWAHPAFANKHVFIRNDKEIVCASLAAE